MKKIILTFGIVLLALFGAQAQTEISGYLDSTPNDGISGAAATFDHFSAVQACRNLVQDGKTDWYLPSIEEILLFVNGDNDNGTTPGCTGTNCDWNSTYNIWLRSYDAAVGFNQAVLPMTWKHITTGDLITNQTGFVRGGNINAFYVRCVR